MNTIRITSADGKKKIEFNIDEIIVAVLEKDGEIKQKKIIKVTDKNKLVMA